MMRVRMLTRRWVWAGVLVSGAAAGVAGGRTFGQDAGEGVASRIGQNASPATSVAGVMRGLASRAGVVFVGQVQSIVAKEGLVEITFLVQQPVLGVVGGTYVEREWAGRWVGGQQRYRVGETAMFFLHAPSAAGLSSTVDGMAGIVSLVPMGADSMPLLDVRRLATRMVRSIGVPTAGAAFGAISLGDATTVVTRWRQVDQPEPERRSLPASMMPEPESSEPESQRAGGAPLPGMVSANSLQESGEQYTQGRKPGEIDDAPR